MATLTYTCSTDSWTGTVKINYTTSYNRSNNSTTIEFKDCTVAYSSNIGTQSNSSTVVTVTANDDSSASGTVTLSTTESGSGAHGGTVTYTATPNPTSITVQHLSKVGGERAVTISCSTTIHARLYQSSSAYTDVSGEGSISVTSTTLYTLTKNEQTGSSITVNNTTAGATNLASGALVADGDVLTISFSVDDGYNLATHTVNDESFESEKTHTVNGNVLVVASATVKRYQLTISAQTGSTITVSRTESPLQNANLGSLSNKAYIYYNDKLQITFSAETGYNLVTTQVNNNDFSGGRYTVTGAVSVASTASLKSYSLTIKPDAHSVISVYKNGTALSSVDTIYHFDALTITVTANSGYKIESAYVNDTDTPLIPDVENNYEVAGDITIFAVSSALGFVYIQDGGATPSPYIIYVGSEDGLRLERYRVYIGTESNGVIPY